MLFAFFAMFPLSPGNASPLPLSEEAYLELVRERNGDLGALRKEVEAQLFSIRADVASQRASLGLVAEEDRWLQHDRGDRYLDLTVTQRIDLAGRYGLQERDLLLGLDLLKSRYADSVNELLARADSAYRQAVMAALNRETAERILEQRRESLQVTQEKFDKELVPILDLLRARSQVDEGEALVLQADQTYEQQLIEMRTLAGGTPVVPAVEVPAAARLVLSVDLDGAWERRPDVAGLRFSRERTVVQRSLAAKGLAPFLDLSVGWRLGEDYRSIYMEDNQGELLAKAVLSIPLADGKKTANATRAAALLIEKADRELEARRDSLAKEVALVRERWDRALEMEQLRRRQMERAAEELEIAEMMYREGLASQLDLISAQETDQRSRTDHLSALQELWLVLAEADRVMGRYSSAVSR
jgi:outer membrane protein TolC